MLESRPKINESHFSDTDFQRDHPNKCGPEVYQFPNNTWPLTKNRKACFVDAEKDSSYSNLKSFMYSTNYCLSDDEANISKCLNYFSESDKKRKSSNSSIRKLVHDNKDKYDSPFTTSDSNIYDLSNNDLMNSKMRVKNRCSKAKKHVPPMSKGSNNNKLFCQPVEQSSQTLWETLKPNYHFLMGHELMDQCMEARGFLKDDFESVNAFSYNKWLDMYETTLNLILGYLQKLENQQSQSEYLYCLKNKIHLICENGNAICQRYPELENEIRSKLDLLKENWHLLINDDPKNIITRFNDLKTELIYMLRSIDVVENAVNSIIQKHIPTSDITQLHSELLEFHKTNVISQNVKVSDLIFRCLKYQDMITDKVSCHNELPALPLAPPPDVSSNVAQQSVVRSPRSYHHCSANSKTLSMLAISNNDNNNLSSNNYCHHCSDDDDDEQSIPTLAKLLESRWNKIRLFSLELILIVESKIKAKSYHLKLNDYHHLLRPNEPDLPHHNAYPKRSIVAGGNCSNNNNDPIALYQNVAIESFRLRDDTLANFDLCKGYDDGHFDSNILSLTKERIILWSNQCPSEILSCNKDETIDSNYAMKKRTQYMTDNGRFNDDDTLITTNTTTITTNKSISHVTTEYENLHGPTSYFNNYSNSFDYLRFADGKSRLYNPHYKCSPSLKFIAKEESSLVKEEKFEEVIIKKRNENKNIRISSTKPRAQINLTSTFPYPHQQPYKNQNSKSKGIPGKRKGKNVICCNIALDDASGEGSSISTKLKANKKKITRRVSPLSNKTSRKFEKYFKNHSSAFQNQRRTSFLNFIRYVNSFKGDKYDKDNYARLIDSYDKRNNDFDYEQFFDQVYKSDVCSSTSSFPKEQPAQNILNNQDASIQTVDSRLAVENHPSIATLNESFPYSDSFVGVDSFIANQNQWFTPEYLTTISPSYSSIKSNKVSSENRLPVTYANDLTNKSSSDFSEFMWDPYQAPLYPHTDSNEGPDEDIAYSYSRYKKTLENLKYFCLNKKKRSKSYEDLSYPDSALVLDSDDKIEDLRSLLSLSKKDLRDVKYMCNYYESKNSQKDDINFSQKLLKFIGVCQIHLSFLQTVVDSISDYHLTMEEKNQTFLLCDHWRQLCYKLEKTLAQNQPLAIKTKTAIINSELSSEVQELGNVASFTQLYQPQNDIHILNRLSNLKGSKINSLDSFDDTSLNGSFKTAQLLSNTNQTEDFEEKKLSQIKRPNSFLTLTRISSPRIATLWRCIKYCLVGLILMQMLFWLSKPTCCENKNNYKSSLFFFLNYPHGSPPK